MATSAASSGWSTGTSTIDTLSCGGWQFGSSGAGEYDDTYSRTDSRSGAGTIVWVCEPQSVRTDATYSGLDRSLMSKTFTPSHESGSDAGAGSLVQESSVRA